MLISEIGTTYEVNDPTGGGWDADHFWNHVSFGISYRCKVLSSPTLRYSEIYDCGRRPGQSLPATSAIATTAPATTAPATSSSGASAGAGSSTRVANVQTVSFTTIDGSHARLNLALPGRATITHQTGILAVTVLPNTVFTIEAGAGDASRYFQGVTPTTLAGGVLEAKSGGFETYAKNITGGSFEVISTGLFGSTSSIPKILANTTGTITR